MIFCCFLVLPKRVEHQEIVILVKKDLQNLKLKPDFCLNHLKVQSTLPECEYNYT